MHARRTDNIETMKGLMRFHTIPHLREAVNLTDADSVLPIKQYVDLMHDVQSLWPLHELGPYQVVKPLRFFLAADNDITQSAIMDEFHGDLVMAYDKQMDASLLRTELWGMQFSVIDLFLLASCETVIGTPFSTFSEAASYIGGSLLLEPDFNYQFNN